VEVETGERYKLVLTPPELVGVYSAVREIFNLFKLDAHQDYSGYVVEPLPVWLQAILKRLADLVVATDYSEPDAHGRRSAEPLLTACDPRAVKVFRPIKAPKVKTIIIHYSCKSYTGDLELKIRLREKFSGYVNSYVEFYREPEE
jgi:hypothetical protein